MTIRRRDFITLLGGAAAWPLAARAQQPGMPVIGLLSSAMPYPEGLRRGLAELGFIEGQNLAIEYRRAEGQYDRLPAMAADLVRMNVRVIVAGGSPAAVAAKAATTTIPIVFVTGVDPVSAGLISSFNRPTENLTGVTNLNRELEGKRLSLLRALLPSAAMVAVLVNPDNPNNNDYREELRAAAPGLGLTLQIVTARTDDDLPIAFATALASQAAAILVGADPFLINRRRQIVGLAARHAIPAIYSVRDFVEAGGLVSYSTDPSEVYRQLGIYAGRIIKGEKLANLPAIQPSKFELVINMGAAKALGLTVPPSLLAIADEVIE